MNWIYGSQEKKYQWPGNTWKTRNISLFYHHRYVNENLSFHSQIYTWRILSQHTTEVLDINSYCCINQNTKPAKMPINRKIGNENIAYVYNEVLLSCEEEWNRKICRKMKRTRDHMSRKIKQTANVFFSCVK